MKRNIFLIFIFFALIAILWVIYSRIIVFPLPDFLEYWASGRLNITNGNPYDPNQMMAIEQTVGWNLDHALMMLNPPWVLSYAMIFGIFSYSLSRFLCFLIQICIICTCAVLLWRIYNGNKRDEWLAWLAVLTFGPILQTLKSGQVTILVLMGTVGFLYFINKKSDFWAGVMASLVLFKPQLLYLFVLALIFWSISRRRYYVLVGMVVASVAYLGLTWIFNPRIFSQYITMLNLYPLQIWMTATLGTYLRSLLNPERFYLQFIPLIAGISWFLLYWVKHKKSFDWIADLPKIILISIATTPYGWTHDAAVCVVGVVQIVVLFNYKHWTFKKILIFTSYWGINLLIMFFRINQIWFWWYPSFLLIWYLLSYHHLQVNRTVSNKSELAKIAEYG